MGIFPEKFALLCEGLAINTSLKSLDLRENQLNDICAQLLSDVIFRNSSLQKLDLRWNNIGLIGGRALLKTMSKSKSLFSLNVTGNNIPMDILNAIEISTTASAERYLSTKEQIERTKSLTSKLQAIEEEKNSQLRSIMEVLEKKEKETLNSEQWNFSKIEELKEALVEKIENIDLLTKKMKELENILCKTTQEKNDLILSLKELEKKNKEIVLDHQADLTSEKKNSKEKENNFLEELELLKEQNNSFKVQIKQLQDVNSHSEEKISKLESQLKAEHDSHEEQLCAFKEEHSEKMRETILLHHKEITRIREDSYETQKTLKQTISLLENQKLDLTEAVQKTEAQISVQKAKFEESMHQTVKQLKSEKEKLETQMEERIEVLEAANKKQEETLKQHLELIYELRTNLTALDLSLYEKEHRVQYLLQCLDVKDSEKETAIAKSKLEFKEQLEELGRLNDKVEELNHINNTLKENITDLERKHIETLDFKENIIEDLKHRLVKQKSQICELLEEESKRTLQLQKTFEDYISEVQEARKIDFLG